VKTASEIQMPDYRKESDSLGEVNVPADKLWGNDLGRLGE